MVFDRLTQVDFLEDMIFLKTHTPDEEVREQAQKVIDAVSDLIRYYDEHGGWTKR